MDNEKQQGGILTMWWHSGTLTPLWDSCDSQMEGRSHYILEMFLISSWWQLGSATNAMMKLCHSWDGQADMKSCKEENTQPHSDMKLEVCQRELEIPVS